MTVPIRYQLTGDGSSVTYWTAAHGPIPLGGPVGLTYEDANGVVTVPLRELRTHKLSGVGSMVTATISGPDALSLTTLSLLLPAIDLEGDAPVDLKVVAIRALTPDPVQVDRPQTSYEVSELTGIADHPDVPLEAEAPDAPAQAARARP